MEETICDKYWKEYINDYLECSFEEFELNEKTKKEILEKMYCDDHFWCDIDYHIQQYIQEILNERGND